MSACTMSPRRETVLLPRVELVVLQHYTGIWQDTASVRSRVFRLRATRRAQQGDVLVPNEPIGQAGGSNTRNNCDEPEHDEAVEHSDSHDDPMQDEAVEHSESVDDPMASVDESLDRFLLEELTQGQVNHAVNKPSLPSEYGFTSRAEIEQVSDMEAVKALLYLSADQEEVEQCHPMEVGAEAARIPKEDGDVEMERPLLPAPRGAVMEEREPPSGQEQKHNHLKQHSCSNCNLEATAENINQFYSRKNGCVFGYCKPCLKAANAIRRDQVQKLKSVKRPKRTRTRQS